MAELIRMPEVLAGAAEAAVQTWLVQPGDTVALNQSLAEIETDKAIVELASETAGTVGRLLAAEGDSVAVGDPIIVMLADGESEDAIDAALAAGGVAAAEPGGSSAAPTPPSAAPEPETAPEGDAVRKDGIELSSVLTAGTFESSAVSAPDGRRLFASPLVRRLATERGVDIADINGTGPRGRVVRRDLERHLEQGAPSPVPREAEPSVSAATPTPPSPGRVSYEDVPLDRMRRTIARRLTESKSTVPHFYLVADCRVDDLLALRTQVNETATRKISVNDFVLKAVAAALVEVPAANATWNGDSIRRFSSVDISVAVATGGGLTTPVLRSVERMSLTSISAIVAELADRGRAGRLKQHELEGGSFSVSNLGMFGTGQFSAILNPPQSGILAVGAARKQPIVTSDGELGVGTVMTVTLSADHRVVDGAVAAEWLAAFQRRIENPLTILV